MKIVMLMSTLILFGFSSSFADLPASKPEKVFTFRIRGEPETLDWNRAHTIVEAYLLMNLMEGLVSFDTKMDVSPALAQSWTISSDGKTYTFKLKSGVKWSDGVPLKAADFVYSWKRLLSPITAASYAYFLFDIEGAEAFNKGQIQDFSQVGITAVDNQTLQVRLKSPVAHWHYIPGFWVTFPLRQDIVEKYGSGWETPGRMVTLGPYSLATHDLDSKIVIKANPYYYREKGNVDQVVALIVKDDADALKLYEAGKIDFLSDLAAIDLKKLSKRSDLKRFLHLKTGYLGFSTDKYPVSNPKLRRAIAMAIDKTKLAAVLNGGQEPAYSFVPPPLLASSKTVGLPFDPIKAKEEFRASGVGMGQTIQLDYILPDWDKSVIVAEFVRAQLKANLGIEVTLKKFDNKTYRNQLDLQAYPLFDYTWTADYPDPDNFLSVFLSSSGNSKTQWKNDNFDRLVLSARQSRDRELRKKTYLDLQKLLLEDEAVIIPLYYEPNLALVQPRAKNYELDPMDYLYLRKVVVSP